MRKNFFCGRTPECQIRLLSWFELDMTDSQNGSQFTNSKENPPFKSNESNEALHKNTDATTHTILKVKSSLIRSSLSACLSLFLLPVFASLFRHQPWQLYNLSQSDLSRPSVPAEFSGGRKTMRICHSASWQTCTSNILEFSYTQKHKHLLINLKPQFTSWLNLSSRY